MDRVRTNSGNILSYKHGKQLNQALQALCTSFPD